MPLRLDHFNGVQVFSGRLYCTGAWSCNGAAREGRKSSRKQSGPAGISSAVEGVCENILACGWQPQSVVKRSFGDGECIRADTNGMFHAMRTIPKASP